MTLGGNLSEYTDGNFKNSERPVLIILNYSGFKKSAGFCRDYVGRKGIPRFYYSPGKE